MKPTYQTAQRALRNAIEDLAILDGQIVGPADASWQDVAGTAATNLEVVARYLHNARGGLGPREMLDLDDALSALNTEEGG